MFVPFPLAIGKIFCEIASKELRLWRAIDEPEIPLFLKDQLAELVAFARQEGPPLAVLTSFDYGAHVALERLREAGLAVPQQVGVFGQNNTPWAEQDDLTSVDFNPQMWARDIFQCMEEMERTDEPVVKKVPPTLVQRGSTMPTHAAPGIRSR